MNITDELCISLFFEGNEMINLRNKRTIFIKYKGIKEYLENRFLDTTNPIESVYRLKHGMTEPHICPVCGKYTKFNCSEKRYNNYCSPKCQNSDPIKIAKDKQAKLEKYGNANYNNSQKQQETCLLKYGVTSFTKTEEYIERAKKTNLEKYGAEWGLQTTEIQEKSKNSKLQKYGDANYNNREKAEQTSLKMYGVKNTKQSEIAKEKEKQTCLLKYGVTSYSKTPECNEKKKRTFLEHYGVEHNTKSKEWQEKWFSNSEWVKNRNERIYETMKKNGSFNHSAPENLILEFLQKEYPDTKYQYIDSKRYPFKCDFYIPSKDVFIEYNGYWGHGPHIFNKNSPDDIRLLEKWKSKKKLIYTSAIKTWTETDPLKIKTAKENGLKYIILYFNDYKNLEEIKKKIEAF